MTTVSRALLTVGLALLVVHLAVVGLLDPVARIWPPKTDDLVWRIVASAQFLNGLWLLLLAMTITGLLGYVRRSGGTLVLTTLLASLAAAGIVSLILLMLLDYLQLRSTLAPGKVSEWDFAVLVPGGFGLLGSACFLVLAVGTTQAWRVLRSLERRDKVTGSPLVVAAEGPSSPRQG